jgi:type IV secretory pathway TrbD component
MRRPHLLIALLVALVAPLFAMSAAGAHTGDQSYVYVDLLSNRIEGRVEYLVKDVNEVLGLDIVDDGPRAVEQLEAERSTMEAFTNEHFSLDLGNGPLELTYEEFDYLELSEGSYAILHFTTGDLGSAPPREFTVSYDAFFDDLDDKSALLIIGRDWNNGVLSNESNSLQVFDSGNRTWDVSLDEGSWWQGMRSTIHLGIEHIRTGADHVMFILVLLLPSVLLFTSQRWEPAPRFGSSLWRVLKVATAFTAAHSITLTLAALGVVNVNSKFVEVIIALSIAAAALHNLRPVFANREWMLAFAFGLFHGLGLAGLLQELGLGRDQRIWTLLGFNLGVELGQAAIIIGTFPTLFLLRRVRWFRPAMVVASIGLAVAALGWAAERVFELEPRVDVIFDPILAYPRVLALLLLGAAIAAGIYFVERGRSRLVPVAQSE